MVVEIVILIEQVEAVSMLYKVSYKHCENLLVN